MRSFRIAVLLGISMFVFGGAAAAQGAAAAPAAGAPGTAESLDSLVSRALRVNPSIHAAGLRVEAARARVGPAGALPDPMLMAGLMNQSIGGSEEMSAMAMKTIGVGQMIPFPGKLGLARRVAERQVAAAEAELEVARRSVVQEVEEVYLELSFLDRSLDVLSRNERLLTNLIRVTEARYGVGSGGQQDVLKARVELARLAEETVTLREQRGARLARLNALLDRPTDTPVPAPAVPERIERAAVPADAEAIRFTSAALGSRAAGSPLPSLANLQETAARESPRLRAQAARIEAEAARVELAGKAHLPDFDLSLQYGQRDGFSDVVSAIVSVPVPLRRGSRQDLEVKEAEADLAAARAERQALANEVRAEVAQAYAGVEQARAQLALFVTSILPQGRAALESATSSFQVGRVDFLTLLENQATLYRYETAYHRALTDFATRLAELERIVGKEILE
jgi:outer membrane protein TolC